MRLISIVAIGIVLGGCADRLLFVEESHLGLKAKVSADSPSPYELDIGYRRGLFALVPARKSQSPGETQRRNEPPPIGEAGEAQAPVKVEYHDDPDELTSMYVSFHGNIGFMSPIRVCHFLATGIAATTLAAKPDAAKDLDLGERCIDEGTHK